MTQKQERQIRAISRFLRIVYNGDITACATILTAEAEILEGREVEKNVELLTKILQSVSDYCGDSITKLKATKENKQCF